MKLNFTNAAKLAGVDSASITPFLSAADKGAALRKSSGAAPKQTIRAASPSSVQSPAPLQTSTAAPILMASSDPGALTGIIGGPGTGGLPSIIDSVMNPTNLGIFGALLNRVGMVADLTQSYAYWPGMVRSVWNMFVKGAFKLIGFEPVRDPQAELMAMYSPIREATEHVTHRAPKGYVVVEFPPGSGEKVAMKKDIARAMKLYKTPPKALMTVTDVRAVNRANAALKRVQTYAMKKNVVEKCAPAGFGKGIVAAKTKRRTTR